MRIKAKNKEIEIPDVQEARGFRVFKGLMFSSRENSKPLMFNITSSLHSFFVFYDFLVVWLDDKNKIVDMRICKPFRFHIDTDKKFARILEIPINRRYNSIVKNLVEES